MQPLWKKYKDSSKVLRIETQYTIYPTSWHSSKEYKNAHLKGHLRLCIDCSIVLNAFCNRQGNLGETKIHYTWYHIYSGFALK